MEEVQKRHRQEQKELQARIAQKKKSATKKTRKGIVDECDNLERQLKEKQDLELSTVNGEAASNGQGEEGDIQDIADSPTEPSVNDKAPESRIQHPAPAPQQSKNDQVRKPNRQKARLARRAAEQESITIQAAEEAKNLPDLRQAESSAMRSHYSSRGLSEHEIRSDGHCLYAAVADQLTTREYGLTPEPALKDFQANTQSSVPQYQIIRAVAASYIDDHRDDFLPFLEEPLDQYLRKIRETGEWGGHLELLALAKAYNVDINVLQSSGHVERIGGETGESNQALWLSYYHHNFGLGEHYNSLRQAD
ncbi:MAG: hypothetical protein LQ350_000507 [Teloschistes chrysophthalmus]|nr:MAG: hypothetical protein LQ350_000507 [Niorma chrysophthalma]